MANERALRQIMMEIERQRAAFIPMVRREVLKALGKQVRAFFEQFTLINTMDNIFESIDFVIEEDPIKELYTKIYDRVGQAFAVRAQSLVKTGRYSYELKDDDDFLQTEWRLAVQQAVEAEIGLMITAVTDSTKNWLAVQMQKAIEEGIGIPEASRRIAKKFSQISRVRAEVIARTEILRATEMANQWGAVQSGVALDKVWLHSGILKGARADHVQINGQRRDLHQPFDVAGEKAMFPRDPNLSAEQSINCRCTAIHVPKGQTVLGL